MARPTKPFMDRLTESLTDPEEASEYINAAYEESNEMFLTAILDVARAHQISKVARKAGVTREHLQRRLSSHGNLTEATLNAVLGVMGLKRGGVEPIKQKAAAATGSPAASPSARKHISRPRRIRISPQQLAFKFDNPILAGSAKPVSQFVEQILTASREKTLLAFLSGNRMASKTESNQFPYEAPAATHTWFPQLASAGTGNTLGTCAEA
jgi:probable addiction module antidote protein